MAINFPAWGDDRIGDIENPGNNVNYMWDGVKWTTQTDSSDSSIGSNPGPNPPEDAIIGDFWFNTNDGQLYIKTAEGDTLDVWSRSSTPSGYYNMEDLPNALPRLAND